MGHLAILDADGPEDQGDGGDRVGADAQVGERGMRRVSGKASDESDELRGHHAPTPGIYLQNIIAYSRRVSSKSMPHALIADPVRLRILLRLERDGPASLDQLADAAAVHVNTVRAHLTRLEDAGVLARDHAQ